MSTRTRADPIKYIYGGETHGRGTGERILQPASTYDGSKG